MTVSMLANDWWSVNNENDQFAGQGLRIPDNLSLGGAAAAHDRPHIHNLVALGDIVAVVAVGAGVEIAAIDFDAFAHLQIAISILPTDHAVFSALAAHLRPRHPLHLVGGTEHGLVPIIDGRLIGVALAVNGGQHAESAVEVGVGVFIRLATNREIGSVHENVRAGFELGQAVGMVDVVRAGGPAADQVHRQAGFLRKGHGLSYAGQIIFRLLASRFPALGVRRGAGIRHKAFELDLARGSHALGQIHSRLAVLDALTVHAGEHGYGNLEPYIASGRGLFNPVQHDGIVHDEHKGGIALRQSDGARNVVDAGGLLGP